MTAPEREKCHKIACPHRPAFKAAHYCQHCDGSAVAAFCICETASTNEIREAFGGEMKTFSPTFFEADVKACARCGNDHPALRFVSFIFDAPPDASHWAPCPQLGEPVLLSIEPVTPDAPDEDAPIQCGTFSEESLNRKPEPQAPEHVRAFGRSLRALREDFGLTLGDLADIFGVRVSRVSDVERGIQRETAANPVTAETENVHVE